MKKTFLSLGALATLVALGPAPALAGQDPAKGKEAPVPSAPRAVDGKVDPLAGWLEGIFGWGPGDLKIEEIPILRIPGYRALRVQKNYTIDPKPADQFFAAVEEGGKSLLVGDVLADDARLKSPAPVRSDADLNGMRELLKKYLPGTPRVSFDPSADRKGWRGVVIRRETGYGDYSVPAFLSAHDGAVLVVGRFWDRSRSPADQRRELIRLDDTPAVGPADARVTVVEYSDMECPSCKKRTFDWDALQAKLAPELKVRRYIKSFPLTDSHPWAFRAASAARCFFERSPELYFRYKSNVYARQEELNVAAVDAFSLAFAVDSGVPERSFTGCYLQAKTNDRVLADLAEGWLVRVRSTPTYVIDGVAVTWFADSLMEEFLRKTYLGGKGLPPAPAKVPAPKAPSGR
ncbi:MAG TPA: DsbA family protein [Thermoanaerobaculia bacterium]|nr:DsbA family protein [Thermoanaerobaculia bacterium]